MIQVKRSFQDIKNIFLKFISQDNFWKKFFFVFGLYLLALSSLILADYLHTGDDFVRAWNAIRRWSGGGRHLNDYIGYVMNFSSDHRDITPIINLIAISFLSFATLILTYTITKSLKYKHLILGLALGLSPYFLQNLSYKFDCAFFCLSVVWSLLPFIFFHKDKCFYMVLAGSCLLICCTYQATLSILGMTFLFLIFQDYLSQKPLSALIKKSFYSLIIILIVVFGYTYIERLINTNLYTLNRSVLCASIRECYDIAQENITLISSKLFYEPWKETPLAIFACLMITLFIFSFIAKASILSPTFKHALLNSFLAAAVIFAMMGCIIIWTIFFTQIVQSPRIIVGFGAFLAIALLFLAENPPSFFIFFILEENPPPFFNKILIYVLCYTMIWGLVVFALRYGNLLFIQWEYDRYKLSKIERILTKHDYNQIIFKTSPRAPAVIKRYIEYPFFRKLVLAPPLYYTNFYFGPAYVKCRDTKRKEVIPLYKDTEIKINSINDTCVEIIIPQ